MTGNTQPLYSSQNQEMPTLYPRQIITGIGVLLTYAITNIKKQELGKQPSDPRSDRGALSASGPRGVT